MAFTPDVLPVPPTVGNGLFSAFAEERSCRPKLMLLPRPPRRPPKPGWPPNPPNPPAPRPPPPRPPRPCCCCCFGLLNV
ncbi:MAG: hypothetical protein DMG14_30650 [Acidobacteria bacterium]|nr:MAG: hypothetical protein DMG14_30650 [Acidobacteriota bacterium]